MNEGLRSRPWDAKRPSEPLAYLIPLRGYGTWLHGDERGSVTRRGMNGFGNGTISREADWAAVERESLRHPPMHLTDLGQRVVANAISAVCEHRDWSLEAIYVGREHVHAVVGAECTPEKVMNDFKAYATRALRGAQLIPDGTHPWSRHGSNVHLWNEAEVARARWYVTDQQGVTRDPE